MTQIAPPASPEARRAAPPVAPPAGGRAAAVAGGAATEAGAAAAAVVPNPALRVDAELGLVVLEFRDARGEVAASFPTSRQLDAYRQAARAGAPRPAP